MHCCLGCISVNKLAMGVMVKFNGSSTIFMKIYWFFHPKKIFPSRSGGFQWASPQSLFWKGSDLRIFASRIRGTGDWFPSLGRLFQISSDSSFSMASALVRFITPSWRWWRWQFFGMRPSSGVFASINWKVKGKIITLLKQAGYWGATNPRPPSKTYSCLIIMFTTSEYWTSV